MIAGCNSAVMDGHGVPSYRDRGLPGVRQVLVRIRQPGESRQSSGIHLVRGHRRLACDWVLEAIQGGTEGTVWTSPTGNDQWRCASAAERPIAPARLLGRTRGSPLRSTGTAMMDSANHRRGNHLVDGKPSRDDRWLARYCIHVLLLTVLMCTVYYPATVPHGHFHDRLESGHLAVSAVRTGPPAGPGWSVGRPRRPHRLWWPWPPGWRR